MLIIKQGNFYCLLIFFFITRTICAQTLNFKHISYKEGLVQSPISNFLQDDKGFIWFGNLKGLTRYDGYEFKTYSFDDTDIHSLSNNRVNIIYQDLKKNLWIGTANGVDLYNRDTENFERIDILEIKGGRNYISSLTEDRNGNIWVGTFAGIRRLNREKRLLEEVFKPSQSEALSSKAIFSVFLDHQGIIWSGTKLGLQKFDPKTGKVMALPAVFDAVKSLKVLVIKQDQAGDYWFGTEAAGVYCYHVKLNTLVRYQAGEDKANSLTSNWVKDILFYDSHTIWFATRGGLNILDTRTQQITNYKHDPLNPSSLNDDAIWSFMKDRASCVWVGTFAGGINFYYPGNSNFQNIGEKIGSQFGLNHILANAVSEDVDGSIWVGTFGGGLNHIDRQQNRSEYYSLHSRDKSRQSNGIKSMADDGKGHLWIGSLDGLSLFNKQSKTFKYFQFPVVDGKLSENLISAVLPDGNGVWVGTNGGGLRFVLPDGTVTQYLRKDNLSDPAAFSTIIDKQKGTLSLSDNYVSAFVKDEKGNLWIGTQNGLDYYDKKINGITKIYKRVRDTKYLLNNSNITCLFFDYKQRLWVGTEGGGLNYYDKATGRFYALNKNLGINDDVIHAIIEDDDKNIWISTDWGIYKIKINPFGIPFTKNNTEITGYSANDGLISNQFSNGASMKLRSGEMLFGGINGLSIFYPDRIIKNKIKPQVALTRVLVNNKPAVIGTEGLYLTQSIVDATAITVPHNQSNLTITYSALNFINPENNQYAYQLEGLDHGSDWQQTGTQRVVNFANLSPGTYTFKVKAANNDKLWGSYVRSFKIVVLPPWWLTVWAYLFYVITTTTLFVVVIRFLRNRARLKRDLYLEHIHNLRQEELYQMKLDFFTNISHEIRTPLTLILGPLDKILKSGEAKALSKPLDLIKNNADRLMKLVTELLDFRKAEEGHMNIHCSQQNLISFCTEIFNSFIAVAADRQINYEFISQTEELFLYFDEDQLAKVLYNLLTNAFKFTPDYGKINLVITHSSLGDGWTDICVVDNGKGIPPDMQPKLFESFFQVDDRGRHNIGSGIGLALSKSIVELHGGKIQVSSDTQPQSLTTFTISLQKGKSHLDESVIISDTVLIKNIQEDNQSFISILSKEDDTNKTNPHSKKYTVLVAEDNEEVRLLVAGILQEKYKIMQFGNALEALSAMETEIPDLIVSDIMMPGMNGLDFCKVVKQNDATSHIPFIMLTAKASVNNQIDGLNQGADAYISKPFGAQILELNIKNLLHAQSVMRAKFGQQFVLQPTPSTIISPEEKFLSKLMKIIEDNIEDSAFDVNELVKEIGMSRTILYKKVQALTGYPVADLIKQIRLKKAAELFKSSTFAIAEVAYMVGFNDRKHFSKEFKKQFDLSPSDFIQTFNQKV